MHYVKSSARANAFRRASIILIFAALSIVIAVGAIVNTLIQKTEESLWLLGISIISALAFSILALIVSGTCRCQLCQASTMRSLKCTHHKNAQKLAGSYRLRIAVSVLAKGSYRCSYCGEAFSLKPKPADLSRSEILPSPRTSARRPRSGKLASQIPKKRS